MKKRGSYFFVLDAIIAGAIFLITVIIILSYQFNIPQNRQTYLTAQDTMNLLVTTKIIDFRNNYITTLVNMGNITNTDETLFNQIARFQYNNQELLAKNLAQTVIDNLVSEQYGAAYYIGPNIIYNRSIETMNSSRIVLTARRISFLVMNETTYFGPEIVELRIWS